MTQPVIEGMAAYKVSVNDDIIDKGYFNMTFDGSTMDVAGVQGDRLIIMSLDEQDIMSLLARPSSSKSLMERLSIDYGDAPMIQQGPILEVIESTSASKKKKRSSRKKTNKSSAKKSRKRTPKSARENILPLHTPVVGPTPGLHKSTV